MIALPLAAVPFIIALSSPAHAQSAGPAEAVELLVKSGHAAAKCGFLSEAGRDELSEYMAKGEIAAVERLGADVTREAVQSGRRQGEAVLCDAQAQAEVEDTLSAAREAVVASELRTASLDEPQKLEEKSNKDKKLTVETAPPKKLDPKPAQTAAKQPKGQVGSYEREALAYYVDRRCGHLSQGDANRFWQKIVARHKIALSRYGASAVRTALKQAEAAAASKRCGSQTASLVKGSYDALRR
jgi:hypothetical protein